MNYPYPYLDIEELNKVMAVFLQNVSNVIIDNKIQSIGTKSNDWKQNPITNDWQADARTYMYIIIWGQIVSLVIDRHDLIFS